MIFKRWFRLALTILILNFTGIAQAGFFDQKSKFLSADEAFNLQGEQRQNNFNLHWQIADGYWIYAKSIALSTDHVEVGAWQLPPAIEHYDEFQGKTDVYLNSLEISLPLKKVGESAVLKITFQGCTEGLCYPPETKSFPLEKIASTGKNSLNSEGNLIGNSLLSVWWFLVLGLGLAFTPCVLPMLPLLSALVIGTEKRPSTARALALSFTYVQGMALTYTLLGLAVVAVGLPFQIALQSPAVLVALAVIFILLSLSMFGLFTLQLPASWQNKLMQFSEKQTSGAWVGVFIMGAVAGLVASPCTSAPLSGALLYVAQSGDFGIGALALYLLALGMGLPLMAITVFGNQILPKSGAWMNMVKVAFGFILLAVPIFLISRLISEGGEKILWALWGASFWLWITYNLPRRFMQIIWLVVGVILTKPWLSNLVADFSTSLSKDEQKSPWQEVKTWQELNQILTTNPQAFAVVDLYANWCVACKELEKYTFSDPKVRNFLNQGKLIRINLSENTPAGKEILQNLQILGLPAVLFFNYQGQEIRDLRLSGFESPQEFLLRLEKLPLSTHNQEN